MLAYVYRPYLCPCCGHRLNPGTASYDPSNPSVLYCGWCARPCVVVVNDEGTMKNGCRSSARSTARLRRPVKPTACRPPI